MMGRFAEHRAQLRRAPLGDPSVGVALARVVGGGHEATVARRVFGIGEAADVGEDGDRGRRDDRGDAGDRLQAAARLREGPLLLSQGGLERGDLLARTAPERPVLRDVRPQFAVLR